MTESRGKRLVSIDALRGLGALMVLGQHGFLGEPVFFNTMTQGATPFAPLFLLFLPFVQGSRGVTLFLVVSGFCIHYRSARRDPNQNPGFVSFWGRRLWRLYPPFLAAIALSLVVRVFALVVVNPGVHWTAALFMQGMAAGRNFWQDMLVHFFMLFQFFPSYSITSGNPVFWSLGLEEQLYLLYFALPWLRRRYGMPRTVLFTLFITVLWRSLFILGVLAHQTAGVPQVAQDYVLHGPDGPLLVDWLNMAPARWYEWMLGAWAVEMALERSLGRPLYRHLGVAVGCFVLGMATQFSRPGWVFTEALWATGFFILLNRLVWLEQRHGQLSRGWRMLAAVGLFSYSLYLTHYPLVHAFNYLLASRLGPDHWYVAYALGTLACIPLAWLFYRAFELPAIRLSHRNRAA